MHIIIIKGIMYVLVAQSCLTLCDPMDCRLPCSSVHGIPQAKNWSGLPFPTPGGLPKPLIELCYPALQTNFLPSESPGKPRCHCRRCKKHGFDSWVGKIPWSKKWQPTPISLLGKSHGQRSLVATVHWDTNSLT